MYNNGFFLLKKRTSLATADEAKYTVVALAPADFGSPSRGWRIASAVRKLKKPKLVPLKQKKKAVMIPKRKRRRPRE